MIWRLIFSALLIGVASLASTIWNTVGTLVLGAAAGNQFANSDSAYLETMGLFSLFGGIGTLAWLVVLVLLLALWWGPGKRAWDLIGSLVVVLGIGAVLALAGAAFQPAQAYYNKTDLAEIYFILPNESAFWIPDVGANQDSQTKFGSEEYYNKNKIPAKRYQIPHAILPKSTGWGEWDAYVPTGRLIIVDRTPQSREWVAASHRGTSDKDQSFPCQSNEGLDITVGVTIGVSVTEENAPKFLYRFGVNPPQGDRSRPEVQFTSVYYGKSLAQVTDGPVRNRVQALVCDEISAQSLMDNNKKAKQTMERIEQGTRTYLAAFGITLDYIGWADTFSFETKVQDAINRRFVADREAEIAAQLAPTTKVLQDLATAEATRTTANKWNGQLPSSVSLWWLPDGLTNLFSGLGGAKK